MFYTVLALAVIQQADTSKHSGVIAFFDREFVKTGTFPRELSRKLHLAFDRRQIHDYGEITVIDTAIAEETLFDARDFVERVNAHLETLVYPGLENGE